jgi:hypothetical protein
MAQHRTLEALIAVLGAAAVFGCSPEADRTRDGGPGGDIGNKDVIRAANPDPRPADTTMMPGRAPSPVERFARDSATEKR